MQSRSFALISTLLVAILAWAVQPAVAGDGDRFWDASGQLNGASIKAKYKESPDNGLVDQTLEVELNNAPPNVRVGVFLNGRKIGSMVTNGFGTGHLRLAKLGNIPGPDGRPTGVRINDGDVIAVGAGTVKISGTFKERP